MKQESKVEHGVCTGDTVLDVLQRTSDRLQQQYIQERGPTFETPPDAKGQTMTMFYPDYRYPQFGDKEFPDNRQAANLATVEKTGELTADDKVALEAYRKYPNSKILGEYERHRVEGTLSAADKKDFFKARVEAGCIRHAHVADDGSIVFEKR